LLAPVRPTGWPPLSAAARISIRPQTAHRIVLGLLVINNQCAPYVRPNYWSIGRNAA